MRYRPDLDNAAKGYHGAWHAVAPIGSGTNGISVQLQSQERAPGGEGGGGLKSAEGTEPGHA